MILLVTASEPRPFSPAIGLLESPRLLRVVISAVRLMTFDKVIALASREGESPVPA